jgi:GNAT superfamily N-acetyltransferase
VSIFLLSFPEYAAFLRGYHARFYAKSCFYLDNLAVDFRYQRLGIGRALLDWGIKHARGIGLPVQTEAGPMGVGLYRKAGFEQVGIWKVKMVGSADGKKEMELPVMRRSFTKEGVEEAAGGTQGLPAGTSVHQIVFE